MSSGKKNICFVTAVLAKSAELATISRAPESKCLHIQLRPTHPPQSYSHGCSEASESRVTEPLCHSSHLRDGSSLLLLLTEGSCAEPWPGRSRAGLSSRKTITQPLLVENSKSLVSSGKPTLHKQMRSLQISPHYLLHTTGAC